MKKNPPNKNLKEKILLLADIGNSNAKFAIYQNNKIYPLPTYQSAKLNLSIFENYQNAIVSVVISEIKEQLLKKNNIVVANPYLDTGLDFSLIDRKTIGSDRVAGATAAAKIAKANLIFIDCGTAITVNAVNSKKQFLGGAIFPGFELLSKSLHSGTSALPEIKIKQIKTNLVIGRNTKSAINAGLSNLLYGGLQKLIKGIAKNCEFRNYKIIITGGYGQKLLEVFPKAQYINNLNLLGLLEIWKINYES